MTLMTPLSKSIKNHVADGNHNSIFLDLDKSPSLLTFVGKGN